MRRFVREVADFADGALGGELSLSGLSSAPTDSIAARPLSDADQPASHAERHQALDELVAQAQALKMGYE